MTRINNVWIDRIDNHQRWGHGIIRQWANAVYPLGMYAATGGHPTNLTQDEAYELVCRFNTRVEKIDGGPLVWPERAEKGREWLATKGVRFGLPRDVDYHAISHFRLEDVATVDESRWRIVCSPYYRAFWPDGRELAYYATPWQAGSDFFYRLKEPVS